MPGLVLEESSEKKAHADIVLVRSTLHGKHFWPESRPGRGACPGNWFHLQCCCPTWYLLLPIPELYTVKHC